MQRIVFSFLILSTLILGGCFGKQTIGKQAASRMAGPAFMIDRQLQAGDFKLTLYERIHDRGGMADLYIEGDDPTIAFDGMSDDLIGLHLASRDKAKNLIYITRPCQFAPETNQWDDPPEDEACDLKYLGTHRFAPQVIESYHAALDNIKQRWGIQGFHIYGHSGGGVIGALLAAERRDILSLTTVSSMLDHTAYTTYRLQTGDSWNKHKPMAGSLNAADVAYRLPNLPQYHYIGGADAAMPPSALFGYLTKLGMTNCVQYKMIQENGYTAGWVDKWPDILKDKPTCRGPVQPVIFN